MLTADNAVWGLFALAILAACLYIARGARRIASGDLVDALLTDDADTAYDTLPDLTDKPERAL